MNTTPFLLGLAILGISGLSTLLILSILACQRYPGSGEGSYLRQMRTMRLKQLSALACLFCLAMVGSYSIIHSAWAIVYLLLACKTGTWWFRFYIIQHT